MIPSVNDFAKKICNGIQSSSLHSLNRLAGMPSGPAAEFVDISLIASEITSLFNNISDKVSFSQLLILSLTK